MTAMLAVQTSDRVLRSSALVRYLDEASARSCKLHILAKALERFVNKEESR